MTPAEITNHVIAGLAKGHAYDQIERAGVESDLRKHIAEIERRSADLDGRLRVALLTIDGKDQQIGELRIQLEKLGAELASARQIAMAPVLAPEAGAA